jgi:heme/copper-type cytochrome/quinol oxidase subunit 2
MRLQTAISNPILRSLCGFVVMLAALAMPHLSHAQSKQQHEEALELLMSGQNDLSPLGISVKMENGMYALTYRTSDGLFCPVAGSLVVPVGIETEITVTSNDKIIRWVIPEADFDVTAIPGRIESVKVKLTKPGRYQVKPPPDNQDKISDVPMHVMAEAEFQKWFKQARSCPKE